MSGLDRHGADRRGVRALLLLFLLALVVLVVEPGQVPLFEPDEGRYSEIPREMLVTGDWIVPRLNGVLYFEKPPLHYWAVALSFRLFGLTELAARVPVKAASAAMALLAFAFARRRWGPRAGALAGLITASSILVFALARITLIDPGLSLALTGAVFSFVAFFEAADRRDRSGERRALVLLHLSAAAAVLLKGLIGLVLPGGAILVWALLTGRWRLVPKLFSPLPLLLFLVLTVPWHVLVAQREPSFLRFYFVHEHLDRFLKSDHRREGSPFYFVAVFVAGFLPWSAFLGRLSGTWPGRRLSAWRDRPVEAFLWIWSALVFLFFSASKSKLIPYLEPIWPAVAVLLAIGIERARARGATFRGERWGTGVTFGLLAGGALVYGFGAGYAREFGVVPAASSAVAILALGSVWQLFLAQGLVGAGRGTREPAVAVAAVWLAFLAVAVAALPGVARKITPWSLAQTAVRERQPGDLLLQRGHYVQVVPFYARSLTPVSHLGWYELNFGQSQAPGPPSSPRTRSSRLSGTARSGSWPSPIATSGGPSASRPWRAVRHSSWPWRRTESTPSCPTGRGWAGRSGRTLRIGRVTARPAIPRKVSVVIPVFNEEANLPALLPRLMPVMEKLGRPWEVVFVDDGSRDRSLEIVQAEAERHPGQVKAVELVRNAGQHMAIMAAFTATDGEFVITLDADLQNPPEEIPKLVAEMDRGADVVGTIRAKRKDTIFRKAASRLVNRTTAAITGMKLNDYGCMLRGYHRDVVDVMMASEEVSTFIPALAQQYARRPVEIEVAHEERKAGESKYSLYKLVRLNFDLMTGFSVVPLQLFTLLGFLTALWGVGFGLFLLVRRLFVGAEVEGVFTLFALAFVVMGVLMAGIGIVGEYVGRIYQQVRGRPRFLIRKVHGA